MGPPAMAIMSSSRRTEGGAAGAGARPPHSDPVEADRALLQAAVAGDRGAWAALFERYAAVVHGIVLCHAGPAEAEDTTQDVFVTAYRRRASVRDPKTLPAWLCAIARHRAIDSRRRRRRRPAPVSADELAAATASPPAQSEARELAARVLELVRGLPEAYRETLVLRLVEGLDGPAIARCTGLTPGSVRVNLCRGMALLRPLLRAEGWS